MNKAKENTKEFILEKVAPIFNRKGYVATSLKDLTDATGLSKGAIYGNFQNKEDLAVQSFRWNAKRVIFPLADQLNKTNNSLEKLYVLVDYYKNYYDLTSDLGGCPILNIGVDTHHTNPVLFQLAKDVSIRLKNDLEKIISDGIKQAIFQENLDARQTADIVFSMLEGGIFMSFLHQDKNYLINILDVIINLIDTKIKK